MSTKASSRRATRSPARRSTSSPPTSTAARSSGQIRVAVVPGDTPASLAARVLHAEHQLYPRIVADLVTRDTRPGALLDRLRSLALALPEAAEKLSHGTPGFFVTGGKFFAYWRQDHHADGITAVLVKASGTDEADDLIDRDPDLYFRPAYLGPSGWIGIRLDTGDGRLGPYRRLADAQLAGVRAEAAGGAAVLIQAAGRPHQPSRACPAPVVRLDRLL